ncbi:glycosyltransferase family 8 protein [Deferribacterales bacterium RsTz2092]|nr:glucosyltransferase [Deferribacterales bacterium]
MQNNDVVLVLNGDAADYLPYTGVAIYSLVAHFSPENNYKIYILMSNKPIDELTISLLDKIYSLTKTHSNITIDTVDMSGTIANEMASLFYAGSYITPSACFRLFIADVLSEYDKVLYLDCDIIARADVAMLFRTSLSGCTVGAVRDYLAYVHWLQDGSMMPRAYLAKSLGLKSAENYFNSGVLLLDLAKWRAGDITKKIVRKLSELKNPLWQDQDILNAVLSDDLLLLDNRWNATIMTPDTYEREPFIVHYNTSFKPWHNERVFLADLWWSYAQKTPFYEDFKLKCAEKPAQKKQIEALTQKTTYDKLKSVTGR